MAHLCESTTAADYQDLFALLEHVVMLKAPSFACVHSWRLEQENKLRIQTKKRITRLDERNTTRAFYCALPTSHRACACCIARFI